MTLHISPKPKSVGRRSFFNSEQEKGGGGQRRGLLMKLLFVTYDNLACFLARLEVIRKSMWSRDKKREQEKAHIFPLQALVKLYYPRFIAYWSLGPGSFSRRGKKKKCCPKSHFPLFQNECNFLSLKLSYIAEYKPCLINSVQFRVWSRRCIIAALQWIMKASHMHLLKLKIWPFAAVWDEAKALKCPNCVIMFSFNFWFLKRCLQKSLKDIER